MTSTDTAILAVLDVRERTTAKFIARSLNMHETSVRRRIDRLEAAGQVQGTRTGGTTLFSKAEQQGHPSQRTAQGSRRRARQRDERVLDALADSHPSYLTRRQVAEVTQLENEDVYLSLRRMLATGEVTKKGSGRGTAWAATMEGRRT